MAHVHMLPYGLDLSNCVWDEEGKLLHAFVENGAWELEVTPIEFICREPGSSFIRNQFLRGDFVLSNRK